ncbi:MAG TPA: protein kinase [Isosphaeraceae bacterium]|nr:protein kinase [Isosphaeraceae bacterium]
MPDDADERAKSRDPEATDVWRPPAPEPGDARPSPPEPPAVDDPDLARFVKDSADIGVLEASEIRAFLDHLPPAKRPRDARSLARELVTAKRLTAYQAGAICQGKAKGLAIGRYVVLDKLGAGGMGVVFKAEQKKLRRVVALKILPPSITREPEALIRFRREAEAAAKLDHPNLVRAIDADEAGGMHFLVMEYIDGRDLGKLVRGRGPLAAGQAVDAILQAARGLAAAHARGIIHRDIKPSNLILDSGGTVKVLDLGLARLDDPDVSDAAAGGLTLTNAFLGTADYMSPEQAFDPRLADARSDIYSLGCTFHFLLTAKPVYGGRSLMQRLLGHREGTIPSLRTARPDVPPALDDAFRRMIAKTPADRPASMAEVVDLLEPCRLEMAEKPRAAPRVLKVFDDGKPTPTARAPRSSRRRSTRPTDVDPTPIPRLSNTPRPEPAGVDDEGSGFRSVDPSGRVFTIHGADAIGFRRWIDLVRAEEAAPTCISAFDGGGRPHFAAIAASGRDEVPWDVMLHPDAVEHAKYAKRQESQGMKLALFAGYAAGPRLGSVTLYRHADDAHGGEIDLTSESLRARLVDLDCVPRKVVHLAGYPTEEGVRFAVAWARGDGKPRRRQFDLAAAPLRVFLEQSRYDGYLPVALTAYPVGDSTRFAAVVRHAPGRAWEARFDLTAEALRDELARREGRGLLPSLVCGYLEDGAVFYAATWAKAPASRRR